MQCVTHVLVKTIFASENARTSAPKIVSPKQTSVPQSNHSFSVHLPVLLLALWAPVRALSDLWHSRRLQLLERIWKWEHFRKRRAPRALLLPNGLFSFPLQNPCHIVKFRHSGAKVNLELEILQAPFEVLPPSSAFACSPSHLSPKSLPKSVFLT